MIDTDDDPIGDALVASAAASLDALAERVDAEYQQGDVLTRNNIVDLLRTVAEQERRDRYALDRADVDATGLRERVAHWEHRGRVLRAQALRVTMGLAKLLGVIHRANTLVGVTLVGLGAEVTLPKEDADLLRLCAVEETMRQALGRVAIDPKLVEAARKLIERAEDEGAK